MCVLVGVVPSLVMRGMYVMVGVLPPHVLHAMYVLVGVVPSLCAAARYALVDVVPPPCVARYIRACLYVATNLCCLQCMCWLERFHPLVLPAMYVLICVVSLPYVVR